LHLVDLEVPDNRPFQKISLGVSHGI
jgi:hypothetical protein